MKKLLFFVLGVLILAALLSFTYTWSVKSAYFTERSWHNLSDIFVDTYGGITAEAIDGNIDPFATLPLSLHRDLLEGILDSTSGLREEIVSGLYNFYDGETDAFEWGEQVGALGLPTTEEPSSGEFRDREDFQEARSILNSVLMYSIVSLLALVVVAVLLKGFVLLQNLNFFSNVFIAYAVINGIILLPLAILGRQRMTEASFDEAAIDQDVANEIVADFIGSLYTHTFGWVIAISLIVFVLALSYKVFFRKKLPASADTTQTQ